MLFTQCGFSALSWVGVTSLGSGSALGSIQGPSQHPPQKSMMLPTITPHHPGDAGELGVLLGAPDGLGTPLGGGETSAQNGHVSCFGVTPVASQLNWFFTVTAGSFPVAFSPPGLEYP